MKKPTTKNLSIKKLARKTPTRKTRKHETTATVVHYKSSEENTPLRINRILSLAGLSSRRNADQWIQTGKVRINGKVITELGTLAVWGKDSIQVDGREIPKPSARMYLILNKPFGYVCALKDPQDRPLVIDLVKDIAERVYPVGRLDFDSLGLLLLTNDGDLAFRLTHPRYQIPRTYKITLEGEITRTAINQLEKGVHLKDGFSGKSKITLVSQTEKQSILRITITQGRSRQVRRMLEEVDFRVLHLIRIGFGGLSLGDLKVGKYRILEPDEINDLKQQVGLK